jgi:serine/threonine protein kinase
VSLFSFVEDEIYADLGSIASDYWCLGILMYEMLIGHPPFYDSTPFGIYEKILAADIQFPSHVDPTARDLISSLLTVDVSKRLGNLKGGANDVMQHPWFEGVDFQALLERRVVAPFRPHQSHPSDKSNFDSYGHYDISNMPAMDVGIEADQPHLDSDPWKHLFTAF